MYAHRYQNIASSMNLTHSVSHRYDVKFSYWYKSWTTYKGQAVFYGSFVGHNQQFCFSESKYTMVLILDGNSEHVAQV